MLAGRPRASLHVSGNDQADHFLPGRNVAGGFAVVPFGVTAIVAVIVVIGFIMTAVSRWASDRFHKPIGVVGLIVRVVDLVNRVVDFVGRVVARFFVGHDFTASIAGWLVAAFRAASSATPPPAPCARRLAHRPRGELLRF